MRCFLTKIKAWLNWRDPEYFDDYIECLRWTREELKMKQGEIEHKIDQAMLDRLRNSM